MSTFDGLMPEFPDIRVDFFRRHRDRRPAMACFLSHVHSDHLDGLETLKSPFVYCSAATRAILLRLERFSCRINCANGLLEKRLQTYKEQHRILKPLPLETPTTLELEPGNNIQVTLFDANHCPGAVMFLFEGQGKATLYTGDTRSEPWMIHSLARHPLLIEYTSGLKTLDTIYLDTSFTGDTVFQTKAEGIRELLRKVSRYPPDTIFHLQAWTYGYEDVWLALSKALGTKIHVDEYKMRVYGSLVAKDPANKYRRQFNMCAEAPGLVGFMCGNQQHEGCLTSDETVRLHSCDKGSYCQTIFRAQVRAQLVWIQPVVCHLPQGDDVAEAGVGGGGDDLERDTRLSFASADEVSKFLDLVCDEDEEKRRKIKPMLDSPAGFGIDPSLYGDSNVADAKAVAHSILANNPPKKKLGQLPGSGADATADKLPRKMTFPYSRHSSYLELCALVDLFKPRDVWPCTFSLERWYREGITIDNTFGFLCSGSVFRHTLLMEQYAAQLPPEPSTETQVTASSMALGMAVMSQDLGESMQSVDAREHRVDDCPVTSSIEELQAARSEITTRAIPGLIQGGNEARKRSYLEYQASQNATHDESVTCHLRVDSGDSTLSDYVLELRANAWRAALQSAQGMESGGVRLLSVNDHHSIVEDEL